MGHRTEEVQQPPLPPTGATIELTRQQRVFTFVGTLLGLLLGALDQNVVATAAPVIVEKLSIPPSLYVWMTTSYMLASVVLVPVWGKLSDLYGRRAIIISGVSLFLFASVLCGFAQDTYQLIAFRALQGAGSASLFTTAFAVVADLFSPAERGKYSGIFGGVFGLASLVGPLLGGFITHYFGWHWVFFINLPVGAVALFFIITRMPPLKRPQAVKPRVDWVGALLLAAAVGPVLVALSLGRTRPAAGAGGPMLELREVIALGLVGVVCFAVFLVWELRREQPLIDLSLFKGRVFAVGNAAVFVFGGVFMAPMVFLPLYMMRVQGVSETRAGLAMVPMVIGILVGNVGSGQLSSRLGKYKGIMLVGLAMLIGSLAVMAFTLHDDATQLEVTLKMVLVGLGLGPSIPLYTVAIQNAIPPQQIGSATGLATFFRQMGGTVGITVAGAVFAMAFANGVAAHQDEVNAKYAQQVVVDAGGGHASLSPELELQKKRELERPGYTDGVRAVYRFSLALAVLAMVLTLLLPDRPLRKTRGMATAPPAAEPSA